MKTYKVEVNKLTLAQAKAVKKVVDQYLSVGKTTHAASESDSIIWGS